MLFSVGICASVPSLLYRRTLVFVGGKVFVGGADLIMDMVQPGKHSKRQIHAPNRNIVVRRARTAGNWSNQVTYRFVNQAIEIKHVYSADDEEQNEVNQKQFMMADKMSHAHISIIYTITSGMQVHDARPGVTFSHTMLFCHISRIFGKDPVHIKERTNHR